MSAAQARRKLVRLSALRLALIYTGFGCLALALFAIIVGYTWRENINLTRATLVNEDAASLAEIFTARGPDTLAAVIDARLRQQRVGASLLLLTDAALVPIAGNLPEWPPEVPRGDGFHALTLRQSDREIHAHVSATRLPGGYHLLVGRDIARFESLEHVFWAGLVGTAACALALGTIGGLVLRRMLLTEVHGINETAAAIMDGDLSRRLPLTGGSSEPELLAQTVNRMLDQIEQLVHGVRNVSNAIAHDLRTPLAELRVRLETLLLERPSGEKTLLEIESAVADVDRVIGVFNALLRLAQIETGARRSAFLRLNLAEVVREAVDFYQPLAEVNEVTLTCDCDSQIVIAGDFLLLSQAIGNLIDNALKYTPKNGCIEVTAASEADAARVIVADNGPGIAPEEIPKVSERFYRGDRSRGTPGVGLGLSLVAAVAALHHGRLELADNQPGLRATLVLNGRPDETASAI